MKGLGLEYLLKSREEKLGEAMKRIEHLSSVPRALQGYRTDAQILQEIYRIASEALAKP
jgi:hypothetical protein